MLSPLLALALVPLVHANFPPTPHGVKTVQSKYHKGVKISYKEPGICETTPGVKSYSGYVHLPPGLLSDIDDEEQDYPINTFFWFFEARKDPHNAPLSIWLNGGPGASSMMGLLQENGPCFVGSDSNSTYLNPWSWNNEVNMLYLDQPTQVGFSYDVLTNITMNGAPPDGKTYIQPADFTHGVPETNNTFFVGTMGSQSLRRTANTTTHAAHALWHFAQTWFSEFPAYKPYDDRVSMWAESYGGHYGPGIFKFFQEQNEKIAKGTIKEKGTNYIHLDTLGLINAFFDTVLQLPAQLEMAYNNTYGIELITKDEYEKSMDQFTKAGGCTESMLACQKKAREQDPDWRGNTPSVVKCFKDLLSENICPFIDSGLSKSHNFGWYDIAHPHADSSPEPYLHGFLAQGWVFQALGVPVNYSSTSFAVAHAFDNTADLERAGSMDAISYLLDNGVKAHMVFGDRDFCCNWLGGEAASLGIDYSGSEQFENAGYEPIISTKGIGGFVRQYGNFSFSRVFQAGHEVPWYQPEVSYNIFQRALFNRDIATGLLSVTDNLITVGPSSTFDVKNIPPARPEPRCYIRSPETCTEEQYATVRNGTAIVKDFFVVGVEKSTEHKSPNNKQKVTSNEGRVDL